MRLQLAWQQVHNSEIRTATRSFRIRAYPNGAQRRLLDRWYPSSKTCSACRHTVDGLRLDERRWGCPACRSWHDRDVNAARNLLAEGLRQLAGRDDRDLRVDAGGACPEEILEQVLAEEARSGRRNRACMEQASFG
jgi:hypothetical protein